MPRKNADAWQQLEHAATLAGLRGSLMFHLDLATELAREALSAHGLAGDRLVADVGDMGYRVTAIEAGLPALALASVGFADDGAAIVDRAARIASERQLRLAAAADTVARVAPFVPGQAKAVLVVPPPAGADLDRPIEAYALRVSDRRGDIVFGPHWHLTLTGDGRAVTAQEPLARAALVVEGRDGVPPAGVEVTHFGAVPGEVHAYLSLKHGVAIEVVALESDTRWSVEAGVVSLMGVVGG